MYGSFREPGKTARDRTIFRERIRNHLDEAGVNPEMISKRGRIVPTTASSTSFKRHSFKLSLRIPEDCGPDWESREPGEAIAKFKPEDLRQISRLMIRESTVCLQRRTDDSRHVSFGRKVRRNRGCPHSAHRFRSTVFLARCVQRVAKSRGVGTPGAEPPERLSGARRIISRSVYDNIYMYILYVLRTSFLVLWM